MKKASLLLLILIYALSSLGIGVKEVFCCGELQSISVNFNEGVKSKSGEATVRHRCCQTRQHYFKMMDCDFVSDGLKVPINAFLFVPMPLPCWKLATRQPDRAQIVTSSHAPPLYGSVPIYITNCDYRI